MKRTLQTAVLFGAFGTLPVILFIGADEGPKDSAYRKIAEVKHLMNGMLKENSIGLRKAVRGDGPATEKTWDKLVTQAAMLGEAGQLLLIGGRARDEVWKESSRQLAEIGASIVKASASKDIDTVRTAASRVSATCSSCHKKHKKDD